MEIQEERVSNTPWQVRCTSEQKRLFQKFVEGTGMNSADAVMRAFEAFRIQIEDDNDESKQILLEADSLVSRLQTMIRSQLVTAIEKQKQCDEERKELSKEKDKYQLFYEETLSKIKLEFEAEKENLRANFQSKIFDLKNDYEEKISLKEKDYKDILEKYEKLESELETEKRARSTVQKQHQESMRLYEIADERLMEFREKIKDFEEKLRGFEFTKEKNTALEKEILVLQMKYDSLVREENIKREFLEKDLTREFEMKLNHLKIEEKNL